MSQAALDFGRADRVDRWNRDLLRRLDDAVTSAGLFVAAGACDARRQDLVDALNQREGRHMRSEWIYSIADCVPDALRRPIIESIAHPLGYAVTPAVPLTDKERADVAESVIRELGPIAEARYRERAGGRR